MLRSRQHSQAPQFFIAIAALPAPKTTGPDLPSGQPFPCPAQSPFPPSSAVDTSPARDLQSALRGLSPGLSPGEELWRRLPGTGRDKGLQVAWSLAGGGAAERMMGSARTLNSAPQACPHRAGSHGSALCQGSAHLPLSQAMPRLWQHMPGDRTMPLRSRSSPGNHRRTAKLPLHSAEPSTSFVSPPDASSGARHIRRRRGAGSGQATSPTKFLTFLFQAAFYQPTFALLHSR